jgi:DNA-directed RNA polymerase specialized sigma subunit
MENEAFLDLSDNNDDDLDRENHLQKLENCVEQLNETQRMAVQLFFGSTCHTNK